MTSLSFFKALADETRLAILKLLTAHDELCVCEPSSRLQLSQPGISRHLAIPRNKGFMLERRDGVWIHYRLHPGFPDWCRTTLESCMKSDASTRHSAIRNAGKARASA